MSNLAYSQGTPLGKQGTIFWAVALSLNCLTGWVMLWFLSCFLFESCRKSAYCPSLWTSWSDLLQKSHRAAEVDYSVCTTIEVGTLKLRSFLLLSLVVIAFEFTESIDKEQNPQLTILGSRKVILKLARLSRVCENHKC